MVGLIKQLGNGLQSLVSKFEMLQSGVQERMEVLEARLDQLEKRM
jgi:hypothetical protein